MPGIISRADFPSFLWPGINSTWGATFKEFPPEAKPLFGFNSTNRAYEEDVGMTPLGLAPVIEENGAIQYDSMVQGFTKRYTIVDYGLGFKVSYNMFKDSQYQVTNQMLRRPKALAFSMRQTDETVGTNIFNRAFNSSYTGADGQSLCATSHPNQGSAGGTQSNRVAADLSEAALEDAIKAIGDFKDDRGNNIQANVKAIVTSHYLQFEVSRILKSSQTPDSANNAVNVIKLEGWIPKAHILHKLTDTDVWFLLTDVPEGLKYFENEPVNFDMDNDFDTRAAKYAAFARYCYGWTDWHGIYGSVPA